VFHSLLNPVIQEMIIIPSAEVLQQMQILVPVALRGDFNIQSCGERLIHDMVETVLDSVVKQYLSQLAGASCDIASHSTEEITVI
jgi:hypothetical protein